MKWTTGICVVLTLLACAAFGQTEIRQFNTTSWHGLTGLYVIPTANTIGKGRLAIGFNESKHSEFHTGLKFSDRQIRGVLTYGITENLEITATHSNNLYKIPDSYTPQLNSQNFTTVGLKLKLKDEHPRYWFPSIAIGVRDIFDDTSDVGPLEDVNNGTRYFLLFSKRMLKNERIGRFFDVHAGCSWETNGFAGLFGIELALTPNVTLIAEGIYDSPYLDFRNYGNDNVRGRYLFDVGARMYPELVPGMVLDTGFVGDSEFEFSFGASYVIGL